MSELCVPNSCQPGKSLFSGHFMSYLARFFAFTRSPHFHYFSWLILFSLFILKLLSSLYPLFITTTLLLLAFLTFSLTKNQESHVGFLLSSYNNIVEKLKSKGNNESEQAFSQLGEVEAYKFLFGTCRHEFEGDNAEVLEGKAKEKIVHAIESTVEEYSKASGNANLEDDSPDGTVFPPVVKANSSEGCKQENDSFVDDDDDDVFWDMKVKKVDKEKWSMSKESKAVGIKVSKVLAKEGIDYYDKKLPSKVVEKNIQKLGLGTYFDCYDDFVAHEPNSVKENSKILETKLSLNDEDVNRKVDEANGTLSPNLGSFGSMRREKEWTKTLACKLFEERHNVNADISEGMDLLWETYECESVKVEEANSKKGAEVDTEFHEDVEDTAEVQMCCLQALKFSAGKVNLGMRSPSLRKISKAFKGIGWLHSVSRNGKKVHHST